MDHNEYYSLSRREALSQLLWITDLMQRDMKAGLSTLGLTQVRAHLIWELGARQPMTQSDLAGALNVTPRNVTTLLDALEGIGMVQRVAHPTDRRAVLVSLSPKGQAARARMEKDMETLAMTLFSSVSRDDLDAFLRVIGAAAQRLTPTPGVVDSE